jgi:hypothetical protein
MRLGNYCTAWSPRIITLLGTQVIPPQTLRLQLLRQRNKNDKLFVPHMFVSLRRWTRAQQSTLFMMSLHDKPCSYAVDEVCQKKAWAGANSMPPSAYAHSQKHAQRERACMFTSGHAVTPQICTVI